MIFRKIDLNRKEFGDIFEIDPSKIVYSWEEYLSQYVKVLNILIGEGINNGVALKQQFMPFLFIFRHVIELTIKAFLNNQGRSIDTLTHNIKELINMVSVELTICFLSNFNDLILDGEGDCFRYIEDNDGRNHFA